MALMARLTYGTRYGCWGRLWVKDGPALPVTLEEARYLYSLVTLDKKEREVHRFTIEEVAGEPPPPEPEPEPPDLPEILRSQQHSEPTSLPESSGQEDAGKEASGEEHGEGEDASLKGASAGRAGKERGGGGRHG